MSQENQSNLSPTDRYNVPGLERGLRLLCEFNRHNKTLTAPELARKLDIPRTTTFRLLSTLESLGFVRKVEGGNGYELGMAVLRLGFEYLASLELTELGQPLLERVRDLTGLSCNLVIRDERSVVFIGKVSAPAPFVSMVQVGTRLPLHATLLGRVLLSDMTLEDLNALYPEGQLEKYSSRTPHRADDLYGLIQQDVARGYGIDEGFFESGVASAAAPVRDRQGLTVAALGVTIPVSYLHSGALDRDAVVDAVRAAAQELSRLLGYQPVTEDHMLE